MASETCKICEQEATPWFYIRGHICQGCYYSARDNAKDWISVKDKLPSFDEIVLIYISSSQSIEIAAINHPDFRGSFWFYPENNGWEENEVTHWMPLPEPPL